MASGLPLPQEAVGPLVAVLIYSVFCLICCSLVVGLLYSYGEKWTYVTILASFTALSSFASIIQQVHYGIAWERIKQAEFNKAVASVRAPALALGGSAELGDVILFTIQYYCYNVMALCVLFWAVSLYCHAWNVAQQQIGYWRTKVPLISKIFALVWPLFIIALVSAPRSPIVGNAAIFFVVSNITLFLCTTMGSVLLILILFKYMKTRRLVAGSQSGGWWASQQESYNQSGNTLENGTISPEVTSRRSIYDRALLTRFSIGFVLLAIFEAAIILFSVFQSANFATIAASGAPNFSSSGAVTDVLLFMPGVTASLVVFLVFGTTKSWRQYRDLVFGNLRSRMQERRLKAPLTGNARDFEFERLPSFRRRPSAEEDEDAFSPGPELQGRAGMVSRGLVSNNSYGQNVSTPPENAYTSSPPNERASAPSKQFHKPLHINVNNPQISLQASRDHAALPVPSPRIEAQRQTLSRLDTGSGLQLNSSKSLTTNDATVKVHTLSPNTMAGRHQTIWPEAKDWNG